MTALFFSVTVSRPNLRRRPPRRRSPWPWPTTVTWTCNQLCSGKTPHCVPIVNTSITFLQIPDPVELRHVGVTVTWSRWTQWPAPVVVGDVTQVCGWELRGDNTTYERTLVFFKLLIMGKKVNAEFKIQGKDRKWQVDPAALEVCPPGVQTSLGSTESQHQNHWHLTLSFVESTNSLFSISDRCFMHYVSAKSFSVQMSFLASSLWCKLLLSDCVYLTMPYVTSAWKPTAGAPRWKRLNDAVNSPPDHKGALCHQGLGEGTMREDCEGTEAVQSYQRDTDTSWMLMICYQHDRNNAT